MLFKLNENEETFFIIIIEKYLCMRCLLVPVRKEKKR